MTLRRLRGITTLKRAARDRTTPISMTKEAGCSKTFTFPDSGSAQATGINNLRDVCGFTIDGSGKMHGWLQVWARVTLLEFPGATATQAMGLNNKGQVVGSYTDSSGNTHGFGSIASMRKWQSIEDPSGIDTVVNGINDNGVLVGFYGTSPTNSGFVATPR